MIQQATKFEVDKAWKIILKDLGINELDILRQAELPEDLFSRANATLTTDEYFRLWLCLEQHFADPLFPLKVGQYIPVEAFNPALFAAFCSPNFNIAMTRLSRYKQLIGPMTLTVDADMDYTTMTFGCLFTDKPLPDSLITMELVFIVHLIRTATREPINPIFVTSTARLIHQKAYSEYFGVDPVQGEKNKIRFSFADAQRPFLSENHAMWQFFEPQLRTRLSDITGDSNFSEKVSSCLYELIPSGMCSSGEVAKKLAVSKRTLQRYLNNENTTFQRELNKAREKLARHYLQNSSLSSAQISFLLGFDDPNSFVRAYRAWTGETPGHLRMNLN
ncbi:MAG: AraC family transcriptional regulator [Spirochaetes bacterium]|nr:AraC family transcriptional regulator [Spirochaetota bacterium]